MTERGAAYAGLSGDQYSPTSLGKYDDYSWNAPAQQAIEFIQDHSSENVAFIVLVKPLGGEK